MQVSYTHTLYIISSLSYFYFLAPLVWTYTFANPECSSYSGAGTNNGIVKAFDNGFGVPYIQWYTRNMVEELFQKVLDPFFPIPARFIHSDAKQPPKLEIFEQVHLLDKSVNRSSTIQVPESDSPIHTEL